MLILIWIAGMMPLRLPIRRPEKCKASTLTSWLWCLDIKKIFPMRATWRRGLSTSDILMHLTATQMKIRTTKIVLLCNEATLVNQLFYGRRRREQTYKTQKNCEFYLIHDIWIKLENFLIAFQNQNVDKTLSIHFLLFL